MSALNKLFTVGYELYKRELEWDRSDEVKFTELVKAAYDESSWLKMPVSRYERIVKSKFLAHRNNEDSK